MKNMGLTNSSTKTKKIYEKLINPMTLNYFSKNEFLL